MNTVQLLIEKHLAGSLQTDGFIKIENHPYLPLTIEMIGEGPNELEQIAVSHHFIQNGDLMRDPEIVFEIDQSEKVWGFHPVEVTMDPVGRRARATWIENGKVLRNMQEFRDLKSFARTWDKNIKEQGFDKAPVKTSATTKAKN